MLRRLVTSVGALRTPSDAAPRRSSARSGAVRAASPPGRRSAARAGRGTPPLRAYRCRPGCRTRRRRRSPDRVRRSRTAPRRTARARRWRPRCVAPARADRRRSPPSCGLPEHVIALDLHVAGQFQQLPDAGQEDAGGFTGAASPYEATDRLREEQRRGGAGGVHADGQARNVDALGHHADGDHPALRAGRERRDAPGGTRRRRTGPPRPSHR